MAFEVLPAGEAFWRPSNQMKVANTDLAKQLGAESLGARLWRLEPGQASTKHRHQTTRELYVVLEGIGRMRVGEQALALEPLSSVLVDPGEVRQIFNDTDAAALWLAVGAPPEPANTLEMSTEELAELYPDGPNALPARTRRLGATIALVVLDMVVKTRALRRGVRRSGAGPSPLYFLK